MIIGPIGTVELLRNATYATTSLAATGVDMSAYANVGNRSMRATVMISAFTTITTATVAVVECATSTGSYTAPANGTTSAVLTAAGISNLDFQLTKKYVRLTYTFDAGGSLQLGAVITATPRSA